MFFQDSTTPPKDPPTVFDTACAKELLDILKTKGNAPAKVSIKKWAVEFQRTRLVDQISEDQIKSVLVWYRVNAGKRFVPVVLSGGGFRKKYPALELAMTREVPKLGPVSPTALAIEQSMGLAWPDGTQTHTLAQAIEVSLQNYAELEKAIAEQTTNAASLKHRAIAKYIQCRMTGRERYIKQHWRQVHAIAWSWDGWKGNLLNWVFTYENRWFTAEAEKWTKHYCGESRQWQVLLKACGYEA